MILSTLFATTMCQLMLLASTAPIQHSGLSLRLEKIDDFQERNHVWAVHQRRNIRRRRYFSLLQLGQRTVSRFASIRLHDQVLASKKLGITAVFAQSAR